MPKRWLVLLLGGLFLVFAVPSLAVETNVYGNPASSNFSVAMAVTADEEGNLYTVGVFFGDFQGKTASAWDVWMARVGTSGGFDWVATWDAPEIDGTDFSQQSGAGDRTWASPRADITVAADGTVVGAVFNGGDTTVVQASAAGIQEGHAVVSGLQQGGLVGGDSPGLIGWKQDDPGGIQRVDVTGSEEWSLPLWADGVRSSRLLVRDDGSVVGGIQLDRLGFQTPAISVAAFAADGTGLWETEINDACFQGNELESILAMGDQVGVLIASPTTAFPSICGGDTVDMASLNGATGALITSRVVKDTLNIIWCSDPRDGVLTDAPIEMGFVDGDECGGADVFWLDWNQPLIAQGSEIEGYAIAGMEIVRTGYLGYGVLHTVVDQGQWSIDAYEYFAPSNGMMPYDMVLTPSGPVIVGRAFNTAWIAASMPVIDEPLVKAASPTTGAAALVTSDLQPSGSFLDDNNSVFEADIEWLAAEGVTRGCNPPDNSMFCPTSFVTRGQMAAFLVRALGLTDRLEDPFVDDDGSIFEADIEKLAAAGITRGCNPPVNDQYCPDTVVTREQMAAFLVRSFGYTDTGGGDLFIDDDLSIFENDIDRLGTAGVTRGCNPPTNNRYCPSGRVTREQMAAFLHRADP